MKKLLIVIFLGVMIMNTGCVHEANFSKIQNNKLYVELEGNATTGYLWTFEIKEPVVECEFDDYKQNEAPAGFVGVGGVWNFVFVPIKDGTTTIIFTHARSWETSQPIDTKTIEVSVKDGKIYLI